MALVMEGRAQLITCEGINTKYHGTLSLSPCYTDCGYLSLLHMHGVVTPHTRWVSVLSWQALVLHWLSVSCPHRPAPGAQTPVAGRRYKPELYFNSFYLLRHLYVKLCLHAFSWIIKSRYDQHYQNWKFLSEMPFLPQVSLDPHHQTGNWEHGHGCHSPVAAAENGII